MLSEKSIKFQIYIQKNTEIAFSLCLSIYLAGTLVFRRYQESFPYISFSPNHSLEPYFPSGYFRAYLPHDRLK